MQVLSVCLAPDMRPSFQTTMVEANISMSESIPKAGDRERSRLRSTTTAPATLQPRVVHSSRKPRCSSAVCCSLSILASAMAPRCETWPDDENSGRLVEQPGVTPASQLSL